MHNPNALHKTLRNKQLASLGDAYVNFIYSLALTQINGRPSGMKVSDRVLAEAFRLSGLRKYMGTRVARGDLANASEALLVETYLQGLITIQESVKVLCEDPQGPDVGFSGLLKLAAERLA